MKDNRPKFVPRRSQVFGRTFLFAYHGLNVGNFSSYTECLYGEINITVVWRWRNLRGKEEEMSRDLKTSHNNILMLAGMKFLSSSM